MRPDDVALTKATVGPEGLKTLDYPEHKRATMTYSQWISGFTEEEIADFMGLGLQEVKHDLQHITTTLPQRRIIQDQNDRHRIMLQRAEQANYSKLLNTGLTTPISNYLDSGVSPAGILREYREAVGLTQKPEPLIQVNTQQNFLSQQGAGSGIKSTEDAIRRVLAQLEDNRQRVIEASAAAEELDQAPADGDNGDAQGDPGPAVES